MIPPKNKNARIADFKQFGAKYFIKRKPFTLLRL